MHLRPFVIDVILICTALCSITFTLMMFISADTYFLITLFVCFLVVFYALTLKPVLHSHEISAHNLNLSLPKKIIIRVGNFKNIFSISLLSFKYVMLPLNYKNYSEISLKSQIQHEVSHLISGDGRFYQYIIPLLLLTIFFSIINLSFGFYAEAPFDYFVKNQDDQPGKTRNKIILFLYYSAVYPLISALLFIFVIKDREYIADQLAFMKLGSDYVDFLKLMSLREKMTKPSNKVVKIWNQILHPSFNSREKSIDSIVSLRQDSLTSNI